MPRLPQSFSESENGLTEVSIYVTMCNGSHRQILIAIAIITFYSTTATFSQVAGMDLRFSGGVGGLL